MVVADNGRVSRASDDIVRAHERDQEIVRGLQEAGQTVAAFERREIYTADQFPVRIKGLEQRP